VLKRKKAQESEIDEQRRPKCRFRTALVDRMGYHEAAHEPDQIEKHKEKEKIADEPVGEAEHSVHRFVVNT
jgi:hypothetical protein